jgi:hypothetical protein
MTETFCHSVFNTTNHIRGRFHSFEVLSQNCLYFLQLTFSLNSLMEYCTSQLNRLCISSLKFVRVLQNWTKGNYYFRWRKRQRAFELKVWNFILIHIPVLPSSWWYFSSLDDRGSRVRFPEGAENVSLHHRIQNSSAHPASYPKGNRALSLVVKRPGREADHSPLSSAKVKQCVELYLHSSNTQSWHRARLKKSTATTLTFLLTRW